MYFRYFYYMGRIVKDGYIGTYASLFKANSSELTSVGEYYNNFNPS